MKCALFGSNIRVKWTIRKIIDDNRGWANSKYFVESSFERIFHPFLDYIIYSAAQTPHPNETGIDSSLSTTIENHTETFRYQFSTLNSSHNFISIWCSRWSFPPGSMRSSASTLCEVFPFFSSFLFMAKHLIGAYYFLWFVCLPYVINTLVCEIRIPSCTIDSSDAIDGLRLSR